MSKEFCFDYNVQTETQASDAFEFQLCDHLLKDLDKLNIMVIDDSPSDVQLFKDLLEIETELNFSLDVWHKGPEALKHLSDLKNGGDKLKSPDLIMLDFSMPSVNGVLVLESIRNNIGIEDIPIIIYSSSASMELVKSLRSIKASAFFRKPLNVPEFMRFLGK
jgi:CheY-like chemotaxis protein